MQNMTTECSYNLSYNNSNKKYTLTTTIQFNKLVGDRHTEWPTDRPTDRQTYRQTDIVTYRAAIAARNFFTKGNSWWAIVRPND